MEIKPLKKKVDKNMKRTNNILILSRTDRASNSFKKLENIKEYKVFENVRE